MCAFERLVDPRSIKVLIGLSLFSLSSCASLKMTPVEGQNVVYESGDPVVVGKSDVGIVAVKGLGQNPSNPQDRRAAFGVTFINTSSSPINFGIENIQASDGKGKRLRVYTAEDLEREARAQAIAAAIAVGLNAGAQSFAAAQPSRSYYNGGYAGTSNYNVSNRYNQPVGTISGYHSGTTYGTATTYNPAQAAIANQAIQANMANQMAGIQGNLGSSLAFAQEILQTTTVFPGHMVSGFVIAKRAPRINLTIGVAGHSQKAAFDVK